MSSVTLYQGDNRDTLRRLIDQGVRVHSAVMDPPYGLVSIKKRFGKANAAPAKHGTDGAFARQSAGFMGSQWDGTGIERDPEFWALVYEILLPGGYCIAFGGASTFDLQTYAMRQAGFIIHPLTGWVFGSGFPKDHDAAKAIDKALGATGSVVPSGSAVRRGSSGAQQNATGDWTKSDDREYQPGQYLPATDEAAQWDGWAYGAQAQKPALEPICVAQKPFSEKNGALNLLKHGVGAINIDGCRVPIDVEVDASQMRTMDRAARSTDDGWGMGETASATVVSPQGRHPANLITDGSDAVRALFPDTSAARFFNAFPLDAEAIYYHAKAAKRDRIYECRSCGEHVAGNKPSCGCEPRDIRTHPTVKPTGLIEHLVRLVTPENGTVLDAFAGTGTTGKAAQMVGVNAILMEADPDYCRDIRLRCGLNDNIGTNSADTLQIIKQTERLDFESLIGGVEPSFEALIG